MDVRVRLACMDATEIDDEPYGLHSKKALKEMISADTEVTRGAERGSLWDGGG